MLSTDAGMQAALTLAKTDKSIMSKNMKKTEAILREMVMITLRSELTKIQRTNLETCITIHMHQKESTGVFQWFPSKQPSGFACTFCYAVLVGFK